MIILNILQESNRRAVIHKLLLNHVKSQQKERKIEQKSHTDNGQYANNFSAPPQTNTFANSSSEEKVDALSIPEEETKVRRIGLSIFRKICSSERRREENEPKFEFCERFSIC